MNLRETSKFLSNYIFILASFLIVPLCMAFYFEFCIPKFEHPQPHSTLAFFITISICVTVAYILHAYGKKADGSHFFRREGFLAVILIWFISGVIGALPFYLSGTLTNPVEAYFESVSGFTTTGASVMYPMNYNPETKVNNPVSYTVTGQHKTTYKFYGNIRPVIDAQSGSVLYSGYDAVGKALLFWRCFMQWVGGMGIVVLFIAILPAYGLGGNKLLMQAELPGPQHENIAPKARDAASLLWKVYLFFTLIALLCVRISNPSITWYDSILISISTISTGGFLPLKQDILVYNLPIIQWIMILFMFLGSVNFTIHFYVLKGKFSKLFDSELILFILSILVGVTLVIISLTGTEQTLLTGQSIRFDFSNSIRYGLFQYLSCQSTTGMILMDYDQWPFFAQSIMITAMYIGGMSCSTAGGIKVIRYYILMKTAAYRTEAIFKPETVRSFRVRNRLVSDKTKETVLTFFFIAITFSLIGTLTYIGDGIDFRTAFSSMSCMINNVGMGYGPAGPSQSFAFMSNFSKIISTFWMILGRLEFFIVLILFTPTFWRNR
ncbi:MAG: Trk system potassium uptake protein TrkG [Chlamydiae bacterium]|nr:Trk system potassium uptake protein TrkG [Chlamydiota bacterium]